MIADYVSLRATYHEINLFSGSLLGAWAFGVAWVVFWLLGALALGLAAKDACPLVERVPIEAEGAQLAGGRQSCTHGFDRRSLCVLILLSY